MSGWVRWFGVLAAVAVLAGLAAPAPSVPMTVPPPSITPSGRASDAPLLRLPLEVPPPTDTKGPSDRKPGGRATAGPDCSRLKCVALTMDDGPVAGTAKVLALLRRKKVHATFFVLGQNARLHPGLIRRMLADGHAVGNHSWSHPQFWRMSRAGIAGQLGRTDALLKRISGTRPELVRPPYGEVDARVRGVAKARGQSLVLWNVDPLDWKDRNAKLVARRVLRQTTRGSIILSHDVHGSTRRAYGRIIDGLKARGFTLVTVPQLLGSRAKPGRVFLHR